MSKKITIKVEVAKPRNHLVALARSRKAGSHQKSEKAIRSKDRASLRKGLVQ